MGYLGIDRDNEEHNIHICTTADALYEAQVSVHEIHRVLAKFWNLTCHQIEEILDIVDEARRDRRALGVDI